MYTYIHRYISYIHTFIHTHTHIHKYAHTHTVHDLHVYAYVCLSVCLSVFTRVYIHTHMTSKCSLFPAPDTHPREDHADHSGSLVTVYGLGITDSPARTSRGSPRDNVGQRCSYAFMCVVICRVSLSLSVCLSVCLSSLQEAVTVQSSYRLACTQCIHAYTRENTDTHIAMIMLVCRFSPHG